MIQAALEPILKEGLWGWFVFSFAFGVIALFAAAFQNYEQGRDECETPAPKPTKAIATKAVARVPHSRPRSR